MSTTPVGGIADAITALTKLLSQWLGGTKGRRTTKALLMARRGLKRALSLHPKLVKDKAFMKHYNSFQKLVTIN